MSSDATSPTTSTSRSVIWRVVAVYLAPQWTGLLLAGVCAAVVASLTAVWISSLRPAINALSGHSVSGAVWRWPAVLAALALTRAVVQIVQSTQVNRIGNRVVGDIQLDLFSKLVRADLARLRSSHTGGFVSSVLYDAGLIREAAAVGLISFVQQSLTLVAMVVVMAAQDWRLTAFVLLFAPLVAAVLRRYSRRAVKAAKGAMRTTSNLSTAIMESLDGVRVVKMENRESYEQDRVGKVIAARQRYIVSGDNARSVAAPVSETLVSWVAAGVLGYEGWRASFEKLDIGALIAFFGALLAAGQAVRQLANLLTVMGQGLTAAKHLFSALDVEAEVRDAPNARSLVLTNATIRLENVSFAYAAESVIDKVSLEARKGETIALVGPSGAGKSTILNLIPRFYDVTAGSLTIDGQDVRDVGIASLRSRIALVTQEPFLFDDTIAANIAYAKQGATMAEIEAAARAAAAHEFVAALSAGYGTLVGEGGARLSGGERQRVAIARAFLKDAPILLLDEPTSALDSESEALIQAALARLMAGRVTVLIAHRLSTVRGANRIYVLDQGRIVESGSHESLVRRRGLYRRLTQAQDLDHAPAAPG